MSLKDRIKRAEAWRDEARSRYFGQRQTVENLERFPNEDDEHFKKRKAREQERLDHREDVLKQLAAKVKALKQKLEERQEDPDPDGDDLADWEGTTIAAWMFPWLEKSRAAGWTGTVVSGYRTPAYSTSLCMNMCGAPSCPGRCAGASSNHSGKVYPAGAVDVSDYARFESIQWQIGSPLRNDLPLDPVHFSVSGH